VPSGVGFAEKLWELHGDLIHAAADLIRGCPCEHGCPACVGPEGMVGEQGKAHALELLGEVQKRIADSEELDSL
jgi:DEAD/DEAH box helicase domain-containing protein